MKTIIVLLMLLMSVSAGASTIELADLILTVLSANGKHNQDTAFITIDGKQIKNKNGKAIAWDIYTKDVGKISFTPGVECFDTGTTGCSFQFGKIFKKRNTKLTKLCSNKGHGNTLLIYKITHNSKTAYLRYNYDEGTIGSSSFIDLWMYPDFAYMAELSCK